MGGKDCYLIVYVEDVADSYTATLIVWMGQYTYILVLCTCNNMGPIHKTIVTVSRQLLCTMHL